MSTKEKIRVENLYKIFGPKPEKAKELLNKGLTKEEILEKTGMTIGVQDASFTVNEGEIFVIMGLSGSGKSTMVRMLNRLIEPTFGHVYVDGDDVASMSKDQLLNIRRKDLSMVFQSFALMPHMTVLENTALGLELSGADKKVREVEAHKALEQVGLEAWADSMPNELSGGMKQRVGLARALAVNPSIMLMDEAFSALDPLIRSEMQDELIKLQSRSARTIVFISHDLDEAMRIGDRIAIMEGGRVVQVGTPEEILQNPADDYVKAFFRGVDPTNILSAGDIARKTQVTIIKNPGDGPRTALQRLTSQDRDYGYVLNKNNKFAGVVSVERLQDLVDAEDKNIEKAFLEDAKAVYAGDSLQDILPLVAANPWPVPVLNEEDEYIGVISKNTFLKTLHRTGEEA
ncbi:glycine betaine/L-proline ABC transporter, ATPase subunit [Denitrovibrio acetiphilus DSM 12809]|uniref:Glycine betaine/L-proline ABC transporter, ATPase subunit n=1 Tax=Denitrovibrio acetiphilus (strain DSM 12809 / NBRC 114555 / N2460) TaxID=522772 RepID=D4H1P1_DENA2|nr:glycine betaine/L-proline ABC transporter ATP-binding protein ProV [Denitrovibrio acetiphilus]ADD68801.1 glycine betaine/L-proline ABC transporter, ATPase subunit [Denitrovibrio acetiphilus DSM 12809]